METDCIRFDMHLHSRYSPDSTISIRKIAQSYHHTGILPLVCDHDTISGSRYVYHALRDENLDIPCILAEEIMTTEGEIIGLFLDEEIPPGLTAEDTLDRIQDQGALSLIPHPFCSMRSSAIHPDVLNRIIHRVDIIEGFNSRMIQDSDNLYAQEYATRHKKPVSAGSDAHTALEMGRTYLALEPFSDPASFLKALPDASIHYQHMHPAIHTVTRLVIASRRIGLFPLA